MKFFTSNIIISTVIPFIDNEQDFIFIRDHLLNKLTAIEHQIASRIAKTIDPNSTDTVDDPLVTRRLGTNSKWINNLIVHYSHEKRLESYKKRNSSIMECKIYKHSSHEHQTHYWQPKQSEC
jgi:predicted transcriptional regulator